MHAMQHHDSPQGNPVPSVSRWWSAAAANARPARSDCRYIPTLWNWLGSIEGRELKLPWSPPQVVLPQYCPDRLSVGTADREARSMWDLWDSGGMWKSIASVKVVPSAQMIFNSHYYFVRRMLRKVTPPRQRKQISDMSLSCAIMILKS